jgi:DNA-binding winged helix-turn-helix (wHTH) protein
MAACHPPSAAHSPRPTLNIVDHIRSLRVKLQNDSRHPRFIATVPGVGYRFIPTFSNLGWDGGRSAGEPPTH